MRHFIRKHRVLSTVLLFLAVFIPLGGASSCGNGNGNGKKQQGQVINQDVYDINQQILELRRKEPLPHLKDSAALAVQNAYYTADADPQKTWYVTLISLSGSPYMHFTTRGAPQPAGDQITNPVQLSCQHNPGNAPDGCGTVGLAEPNGVHQSSGSTGYVAVLTTGAVTRFECGCVISDQPFDTKTPVQLSINENAQISHTDPSVAVGGVIPKGTSSRATSHSG